MGLSLSLDTHRTGTGTSALSSPSFTKPALNDLVVFIATAASGTTYGTVTDNLGGSGGTWHPLGSVLDAPGVTSSQGWYKTANAADVAGLSSISCTLSPSSGWGSLLMMWTGFTGAATLDQSGTYTSGAGTTNNATVTFGAAQKVAEEIALYYAVATGNVEPGTPVDYYSPNGGVTQYAGTASSDDGLTSPQKWAHPTTGGATPEFVYSYTGTAFQMRAYAATFYDPGGSGQQVMIA